MKLSQLSPALSLPIAITIATLFQLAEPAVAATDKTAESTQTSTASAQTRHRANSLSQVRGDLAATWNDRQGSVPTLLANANDNNPFKDFPQCACPQCSEIIRQISS